MWCTGVPVPERCPFVLYMKSKAAERNDFSEVTTRRSIIATNGQRILTKDRIAGGGAPPKKYIAPSPMEIQAVAALRSFQPFTYNE